MGTKTKLSPTIPPLLIVSLKPKPPKKTSIMQTIEEAIQLLELMLPK